MFQIPDFSPKSPTNRFEFQMPARLGSAKLSVPLLAYIPIGVMKDAREADTPLQALDILGKVGERRAVRLLRRLNQLELATFEAAWADASVVSLGELAASSR